MKTHVIYHRSDFDGIFCREIARKFLPEENITFYGIEYGDPIPPIPKEDRLYILDFSVPELMNHPNLIWIDHHKTAIEKFGHKPGVQIDGVAACRLAWQWFVGAYSEASPYPQKQDYIDRSVVEPLAVRLAGEYDVWDKRDPNAELFQHGLRSLELTPEIWARLLDDKYSDIMSGILLKQATAVQYAKTKENESIVKNSSFTIHWEGFCFICCNHARGNSLLFTAALEDRHDACLCFHYNGKDKLWKVSLYGVPGKPDVDLSPIAKVYGGGGHKQACGFSCHTLPFILESAITS